jgi:hypothetical protein
MGRAQGLPRYRICAHADKAVCICDKLYGLGEWRLRLSAISSLLFVLSVVLHLFTVTAHATPPRSTISTCAQSPRPCPPSCVRVDYALLSSHVSSELSRLSSRVCPVSSVELQRALPAQNTRPRDSDECSLSHHDSERRRARARHGLAGHARNERGS